MPRGGYLRLEYEIELSSFTGAATADLPSPKQTNSIKAESVTVPTDATIVVGGLVSESNGKTVVKVPLLGDIPILGNLFRDTSETKSKTTLFVFITPKIMRDPSFADLKLITRGPLVAVGLPSEMPEPAVEAIDFIDSAEQKTADEKRMKEENRDRTYNIPRPIKRRSDGFPD